MSHRSNVMFIIADQHNAKCLGCAGHPQVKTPNLDALTRRGVRFTCAVTTSPICTPSRLSYLTGQYCLNHCYYGNGGNPADDLPSLLGHLRSHGYRTASIGHINVPRNWQEKDTDWFRDAYPSVAAPYPWMENYVKGPYDEYLEKLGLLRDRDDYYFIEKHGNFPEGLDGRPSRLPYEHSVEAWCVREAQDFIESCQATPWFTYLSLPRPHENYTPARQFWDMYTNEPIWLPPSADYDMSGKAPHLRKAAEGFRTRKWTIFEPGTFEAGRERKQRGYLGCVSQVDHAVGQMLGYLENRGLLQDTIVIYTADHGEYASAHSLMEKAPGICGDDVCRVPSIWNWKGHFAEGLVSQAIIQHVDVAPTLLSLLGLPPMRTVDGEDISLILKGQNTEVRDFAVTEFPWTKAVLKGDWRLVYYPRQMFAKELNNRDFGELYNLAEDPYEMQNLYFLPEHQEKARELQRDLLDWIVTHRSIKTVHPFVPPCDGPGDAHHQRAEVDGKLHWRDVAAQKQRNKYYL